MTVAVTKALADGAAGRDLRLDGEHGGIGSRVRGARRDSRRSSSSRRGPWRSESSMQARAVGARVLEVRGTFDQALAAARELGGAGHARARELRQPVPARGPEDGRVRDRRGARRAARRARAALRRRRQHRARTRCGFGECGRRCRGSSPARPPSAQTTAASAIRIAEPVHRAEADGRSRLGGRIVSLTDDEILAAWRELAEREGVFCEPSSAAGLAALDRRSRPAGDARRLRRSPATASRIRRRSAALDPATPIDVDRGATRCRGAGGWPCARPRAGDDGEPRPGLRLRRRALDLWNELEVSDGEGSRSSATGQTSSRAPEHLGSPRVRAARAADGQALPLHEPDPARARPRLERVGDRARARRRRDVARSRAGRRGAARARDRARGPRRQPRRRPSPAASA